MSEGWTITFTIQERDMGDDRTTLINGTASDTVSCWGLNAESIQHLALSEDEEANLELSKFDISINDITEWGDKSFKHRVPTSLHG